MKVFSIVTVAAGFFTAVYAAERRVKLRVESGSGEIANTKGVSSLHEGAGINYLFLGAQSQELIYDDEQHFIYAPLNNYRQYLGVYNNILQLSVAGAQTVDISTDYLKLNNSVSSYYACKNINDPYHYSDAAYALTQYVIESPPEGCIPVKVVVEEILPSGAPSGSTSETSVPSSTIHASYLNTTVIESKTVTDYVTYCPETTIVTVTTCSQKKCNPTTITVTEPTTLTVTGECVVPATYTRPTNGPSSTTAKTVTNASSSFSSSTSSVAFIQEGGAAKNIIGLSLGGISLLLGLLI